MKERKEIINVSENQNRDKSFEVKSIILLIK